MRRSKVLGLIGIPLLGALAGIVFQNELFADYLFMLAVFPLAAVFLAIVGLFALAKWGLTRKCPGSAVGYTALVGCSLILALILFSSVGIGLDAWKNYAVRAYVARAVPILDAMKARDGYYPSSLPVAQLGEPPSLLRNYGDYSSDGGDFRFEYVDDPAGWAGGEGALEFTSSDHAWTNDR